METDFKIKYFYFRLKGTSLRWFRSKENARRKNINKSRRIGITCQRDLSWRLEPKFYKCITIKVNEGLKSYLSKNKQRDGVDRPYYIPDIASLNYYLDVRVEDIRDKESHYECDLRVIFSAEKNAFKESIA